MVFWNLLQNTVRPPGLLGGDGGWGGLQELMHRFYQGGQKPAH
jgi:hypothetical protein